MSEAALIHRISQLAGAPFDKSIIRSIGDDCAILRPTRQKDLVFTTDFVLENRHFTLSTHTAAEIGHKALARSLSDLAAMGAEPLFCLVSLALPAKLSKQFVPAFYKGLMALAHRYRISVAGGDLAQFPSVVADVMCCGTVPQGQALLRSAAKVGDFIYVSGQLGGSALGFRTRQGQAWKRHRRPEPRIALASALRKLKVRCAMDLSDGLSLDLARICTESDVSASLMTPLPIAIGASMNDALNGGEDYEILFTAGKKIPAIIEGQHVTKVGVIVARSKHAITLDGKPLKAAGFDHFA